jgi:hypothetical protein
MDMLAFVGVMSSTPVNTLSAGSTVVAPKGEISAEMETRKMIHVFIRELKIEYGGPDTCRLRVSRGPFFSTSTSGDASLAAPGSFLSSDTDIDLDSLMVAVHERQGGHTTVKEGRG